MKCVNSFNEWDPLEEIIVGNGFPAELPSDNIGFKFFFHDNLLGKDGAMYAGRWYLEKRFIEELREDLEAFVELLKQRNICVKRPKEPVGPHEVKTLCWSSSNYPALNVRDLTLIVGNEIIETSVLARWRQFENDYLKHLFLDYFKRGAKWTAAPRPLSTDKSIDYSRVEKNPEIKKYFDLLKKNEHDRLDCGIEIMFDAANCIRMGDVIMFNAPTEHERLGAEWLQRHLGKKYKIWTVNIFDNHIDSLFLPIRPGLAILTLPIKHKLPEQLKKWDIVYVPSLLEPHKTPDYMPLASEKIFCNLLSLSPNEVLCQPEYYNILSEKLRPYKIDVIPNRLRHSRLFGGGHHCLTLDVRRKGKLESYF